MTDEWKPILTIRMNGPRFASHAMDLTALTELIAYQNLIVFTAKELFKQKNPDKARLPKGFEEELVLRFTKFAPGSVAIPLEGRAQTIWGKDKTYLEHCVDLISETVDAAGKDSQLPDDLPTAVIPKFEQFGRTLMEDTRALLSRSRG